MKQARTSDDENDVDAIESEQRHDCGKNSSNDKLQKKNKYQQVLKSTRKCIAKCRRK